MDAQSGYSASDVARRALALADDGRWGELVALAEADILEEHRRSVIEGERRRQQASVAPMREDMPEEVRRWYQEQYEQHRRRDGIATRYARVQSFDELNELSAVELLVREIEANDVELRARARAAGLPAAVAEDAIDRSRDRRQLVGVLEEGAFVAHALYRRAHDAGDLNLLTLRRTDAGWRIMPGCELLDIPHSLDIWFSPTSGVTSDGYAPLAVEPVPWIERTFPSGLPAGLFPALLARFEANVMRISGILWNTAPAGRTSRPRNGGWSIQEHAGHLLELERLGEIRLAEFERGAEVLSAADMDNRATKEADYNTRRAAEIGEGLSVARRAMVARLEGFTRAQIEHAALHPRLQQPMNVVDWLFFMCEHDDHHIAHMRLLQRAHWRNIHEAQPQ